jgi:hypothetical protein
MATPILCGTSLGGVPRYGGAGQDDYLQIVTEMAEKLRPKFGRVDTI